MKAKHDMTKRNTTSNETPSIVLKTIINDIVNDNPDHAFSRDTERASKRVRVWLRANMRDVHEHNASWIFTQSQRDIVRSQFDPAYRAKIERATKRNAKTNATNATTRKPRAKKNDAQTNVAPIVADVDANA